MEIIKKTILIFLCTWLTISCSQEKKPNIIFIMADDLGWQDVGFMGSKWFETPNLDALKIASIYKSRWQIEVFFKWIKQNLEVKKLWGHSQNAVKTQLWIAISTYLIVAQLKKHVRSKYSIYEMTQILSISTFDKTPVNELFMENKINQKAKEQPNLFNNNEL